MQENSLDLDCQQQKDENEWTDVKEEEEDEDKLVPKVQLLSAHVSLNFMLGQTHLRSIKLKGELKGREIIVLIDSGASHKILCANLVEEFQFPSNPFVLLEVTLGNGKADKGQGLCAVVKYPLQGTKMTSDFLPFKLGEINMILRMP